MKVYIIIAFVIFLWIGVYFTVKSIKKVGIVESEHKTLKITNEIQNKINSVGNVSYHHKLLIDSLRDAKSSW